MEEKIRELNNITEKLRWDMFKEKEIANLISRIFNSTKVMFERDN